MVGLEALLKMVAGLCEEVHMLRDDLYNHAMITRGEAFAGLVPATGAVSIGTANMPPGDAGFAQKAYQNSQNVPVVVVVRLEPLATQGPPSALALEDAVLLVSTSGAGDTIPARAALAPAGKGQTVVVVLKPGDTLFVGAMASAAVTVTWRALALRGRAVIFGG